MSLLAQINILYLWGISPYHEMKESDSMYQKKNDKEKWIIFLLLFIFLMFGIIIGILLFQNKKYCNCKITDEITPSVSGVGITIDPDANDKQPSNTENIAEQGVAISGREYMTIPAGQKEVAVDFYNPEENKELYYLTFELRLYDDNELDYEVLYTSGLVEPSKHIQKITLSRVLEEGIYTAVIHVQPYRMDEQKSITNNADMKIYLIVK